MSVLLIEKINHRFKRMTGTKQSSGLSVCLDMIVNRVSGVNIARVDNIIQLDHSIQKYKPKKVVIEAIWVGENDLKILREKYPRKQFFIHIHSNIPFLSCEGYAVQRIAEANKQGVGVIFNSLRAAQAFKESVYLPNIYNQVPVNNNKKHRSTGDINVACGGSIRPMKDPVSQALGAILYADNIGKKLIFHANIGRSEGGDEIKTSLKSIFSMNPKHDLVTIPWKEHKDFIEFLRSMDFGLQVSLSESFNIVAADYVAANIPMIVSDEIEWAHETSKVPPGDPIAIANKMDYLSNNDNSLKNIEELNKFSNNSVLLWEEFRDS